MAFSTADICSHRERIPALRLAGGAGGFGPNAVGCSNGSWVTHPTPCPAGSTLAGTPLLLYLQETGTGPNVDPPGKSLLVNEDLALFAQDQWQVRPNVTLNYGPAGTPS